MTWLRNRSLVLTMLLPLAGCSLTAAELTQTTGRIGTKTDAQITAEVCRAWTAQDYDSLRDTGLTVKGIQELNRRREAYCNKETSR